MNETLNLSGTAGYGQAGQRRQRTEECKGLETEAAIYPWAAEARGPEPSTEIAGWSGRDNFPTDYRPDWRPLSLDRQVWSRRRRTAPATGLRV